MDHDNNVRKRSWSKVKFRKLWQSQDWRQEKWCCVYGGIGKKSFTTSCCSVKRLILISIVNNWKDYVNRVKTTRIDRKGIIFYHDNTRPHTSLAPSKLRELSWEVLMHPSYSPDHQTTICFDFYRTLLMV